jgi:predicted nuclease of predicted toxin-antitoxin system
MRLLFDHNLSPKLAERLSDLFPEFTHVHNLGMSTYSDLEIWNFAKVDDFFIVTKDSDFHELTILRGHPPKVIWMRRGNCSTDQIEKILRENAKTIKKIQTHKSAYLILR